MATASIKQHFSISWLCLIIVTASVPVLIILADFAFLLSSNSYIHSLAAATATPENSVQQMTRETAAAVSADVIAYVKSDESELQYAFYFRPEELSHLTAVRNVVSASFALMYFLAVVIAASIAWLFVISRKTAAFILALRRALFWSGMAVAGLVVLLFLASLSFDFAFAAFHKLLFRSGQWQFPENYVLVNLFTTDFFARMARDILLGSLFFGVSLIASAAAAKKFIRPGAKKVVNVGK